MVSHSEITGLVQRWMTLPSGSGGIHVRTDASDFFRVESGDVLLLEDHPFLIRNNVREGRFGLDDEVKHWVKRAIDLRTGEMKVIKFVFHEKFTARIGGIDFECNRSPLKEAYILKLVEGHPGFMHGQTLLDVRGNPIRILDYISGVTLADHISDIQQNHEAYFHLTLPDILRSFIGAAEAIRFLHERGTKHGDIRRDHLIIDSDACYRWIDFDYTYEHRENLFGYDLFGLGNVLLYVVGKGDVLVADLKCRAPDVYKSLTRDDVNIVFNNRLANLKKAYPYIPEKLNRILGHFAGGANWFYETTHQLIADLEEAVADMR
jgi:tRNA A-37 threonylcarbamoyl transferase component Bud32